MADSNPEWPGAIRTPDQRLRVFVSSTLGELQHERVAARAAIEQLRLVPVMFESGARPHPAQVLYRAYLEQSEIFVGIYWQSYGWVGPGMTFSGLEDEFRESSRLPRLLYLKRPAADMEPGLRRMLDRIRSEGDVAYKAFADADELRELLLDDLATLLAERFGGPRRGEPEPLTPSPPTALAALAPPTALVGRDRDVGEVVRLLAEQDHRLVVLTGPGGVGKTRLAQAVMEHSRTHWADGVAFVDLSPVSDPQSVPEAIASALGFVGQGREQPLDTLGGAWRVCGCCSYSTISSRSPRPGPRWPSCCCARPGCTCWSPAGWCSGSAASRSGGWTRWAWSRAARLRPPQRRRPRCSCSSSASATSVPVSS